QVRCSHCQATLQVPDQAAGKQGRCPKCQGVIRVPPAPSRPAPAPAASAQPSDSGPARKQQAALPPSRGSGLAVILIVAGVGVLLLTGAIAGGVGWLLWKANQGPPLVQATAPEPTGQAPTAPAKVQPADAIVLPQAPLGPLAAP